MACEPVLSATSVWARLPAAAREAFRTSVPSPETPRSLALCVLPWLVRLVERWSIRNLITCGFYGLFSNENRAAFELPDMETFKKLWNVVTGISGIF